jgi:hypothetical protein
MAIYVYNTTTGALVSYCPNDTDPVAPAATLAANGLTAVSGLPALSPTTQWSASSKTVVTVTAPVNPNWIPTYQFILLFTPAEHAAIQSSTDQRVTQFLMAITTAQQVNLNDPILQNGISYLVSISLLTQANATLILSGQPSQ